ncbi:MAG: FkbM family methyltransferase [Ferruginibacter sp.]
MTNPVLKFLYRFKSLRKFGRKLLKGRMITQPFYNGVICFNAVEFASFWVNDARCENVDKDIQDKLLQLSLDKDVFVDIGSNIGIMTLSIALRNPHISVRSYDPNNSILSNLKLSVKKNKLQKRVSLVNAAVSDQGGKAYLNFSTNSYSGYIADKGIAIDLIDFEEILKANKDTRALFKMDIEGFEKNLVRVLTKDKNPLHVFVIEIHPHGLNGVSDPDYVVNELLSNGYSLFNIAGDKISSKKEISDWDNIVCFCQ